MRVPSLKVQKRSVKVTAYQYVREYLLHMVDGFIFFGFDDTKLVRIYGGKENICTKLKSIRWLLFNLSGIFVALWVVGRELPLLGQQKTQKVDLVQAKHYVYDAKDCLRLMLVGYFDVEEIFPRAQQYQNRTSGPNQ